MKTQKTEPTIKEVYLECMRRCNNNGIVFGANGHHFVLMKWTSPYNKVSYGPFLITVSDGQATEIDKFGQFVNSFPATTKGYSPWFEPKRRKKSLIKDEK